MLQKNRKKIGCRLASWSKGGSNGKSLTFLLVCRNLPRKANLKNELNLSYYSWNQMTWNITGDVESGVVSSDKLCQRSALKCAMLKDNILCS